jgi:hypothetical protein
MSQGFPPPPPLPDDDRNPYAAPKAGPEIDWFAGELTPGILSLDDVLTRSWNIFRDRMGLCIGIVIGAWAMTVGVGFAINMAQAVVQAAAPQMANGASLLVAVTFVGFVVNILFNVWVYYIGPVLPLIDIAQGRATAFGEVFNGGRSLLRVILAFLLVWLICSVPFAIGAVPGAVALAVNRDNPTIGGIVLGLGLFAALAAAAYIGLRLGQFRYLIIHRDLGSVEALQVSYEITRGNVLMLLVVWLLIFMINLAGVLACCVGIVFALPYTEFLKVIVYLSLTGQPTADGPGQGRSHVELEPL